MAGCPISKLTGREDHEASAGGSYIGSYADMAIACSSLQSLQEMLNDRAVFSFVRPTAGDTESNGKPQETNDVEGPNI